LPVVQLVHITKRFPANEVHALDNADFDLREGEIHALVGENGAGKSTLMHILAGSLPPSSGRIVINSVERRFKSPKDALNNGIGMVRQHPSLVPNLTVWENCALGAENGFFVHPALQRAQARNLCAQWGFDLPFDRRAGGLSVCQRQFAAIVNALLRKCRILIFDEVTAVVSQSEAARLFTLFDRLKRRGFSLIIISHKLDEVLSFADRITVLRAGKAVAALEAKNADVKTLNALMFGEPAPAGASPDAAEQPVYETSPSSKTARIGRRVILSVKNLAVEAPDKPFVRNIDMEIRSDSITGIAGVRDSGLETLELALAGLLPVTSGDIILNNTRLSSKKGGGTPDGDTPALFRNAGMAYLNADRTNACLAMDLSMWDNLVVHAHRRQPGRSFFLDTPFLDAWAQTIMARAGCSRSTREAASSFSGGQLQKLLLERELAELDALAKASPHPAPPDSTRGSLLILSEPGWGLDAQARKLLADKVRSVARRNVGHNAVLLFSTDIDELLEISDEILVLNNGAFSAKILVEDRPSFHEYKNRIIQAMTNKTGDLALRFYEPLLAVCTSKKPPS
jgi:simple sugar transport system ATP-binding protein